MKKCMVYKSQSVIQYGIRYSVSYLLNCGCCYARADSLSQEETNTDKLSKDNGRYRVR